MNKNAHKKWFAGTVLGLFALTNVSAQDLPAASPAAKVSQTAGLTEISVDYSSPGVKGRTIWGDLVPYEKVWRAGANSATKVSFSEDVRINGSEIAKGTYSFFAIPSASGPWTLILNKDEKASEGSYKQEKDALRISATPMAIPFTERLAYSVTDFDDDKAHVNLDWEKVRVSFAVELNTAKQASANIEKAISGAYRPYMMAARYQLSTTKDYDKGIGYINQAIAMNSDNWFNYWIKAELHKAKGDVKGAHAAAVKAQEIGNKNPAGFFFKDQVDKAVAEWAPAPAKKK